MSSMKQIINFIFKNKLLTISTFILFSIFILVIGYRFTNPSKDYYISKLSINPHSDEYRLSQDNISSLSPEKLYQKYSSEGKETYNNIFKSEENSRNYALTLVGKKIPETQFIDMNEKSVDLSKGKNLVTILNTGTESKKALDILKDKSNLILVFPADNKDTIKDFIKDFNLSKDTVIITQNNKNQELDLLSYCKYTFNVVGAPSIISVYNGNITLALNSSDKTLINNFTENMWKKPYLYEQVTN